MLLGFGRLREKLQVQMTVDTHLIHHPPGVGISCYRLGELKEAEQALSEANILNNTDPEVWGYLSMVCLKTSR